VAQQTNPRSAEYSGTARRPRLPSAELKIRTGYRLIGRMDKMNNFFLFPAVFETDLAH
jgi:hypothetical protein